LIRQTVVGDRKTRSSNRPGNHQDCNKRLEGFVVQQNESSTRKKMRKNATALKTANGSFLKECR